MIAWPSPPKPCGKAVNLSGRRRSRNHGRRGIFGDPLKRTKHNSIRILLQNVGGIGFITGKRCHETLKMEKLKELCLTYNVDLMALTEVNKDWRKVTTQHTIWEGTKGWKESRRIQVSSNTTQQAVGEFLVGGTAMCAFDEMVFRISSQGYDERN